MDGVVSKVEGSKRETATERERDIVDDVACASFPATRCCLNLKELFEIA